MNQFSPLSSPGSISSVLQNELKTGSARLLASQEEMPKQGFKPNRFGWNSAILRVKPPLLPPRAGWAAASVAGVQCTLAGLCHCFMALLGNKHCYPSLLIPLRKRLIIVPITLEVNVERKWLLQVLMTRRWQRGDRSLSPPKFSWFGNKDSKETCLTRASLCFHLCFPIFPFWTHIT